ncbi:hypothetical protein [Paenibacillus glycanilyticus]|uniref:DUF4306 domain-containing protein n=1 Tax=Paenibacillus glycanilyticus TaxID=126569 RepID=A0ABQ6GG16_9BACL|nr:hypothetical protein [Paenibacillus glycanilyticus]GLX69904.1 hypothetical protein MU1_42500 [Paenibacillus glycanilyticus]
MKIKSILWQGVLLGLVLIFILAGLNLNLVRSLLGIAHEPDDFGYQDSTFVVYNGPFEGTPWLAAAFWILLVCAASITALTIFKLSWFALRRKGLASNR